MMRIGDRGIALKHRAAGWRAARLLLCAPLSACLFLAAAGPASAATTPGVLVGAPPITRFKPGLDVFPQNFAIAQDDAGVIYVANGEGVLTFDGGRWARLALPNHDLARTLAWDGRSRMYVGGYDVFGYIERDSSGEEIFHDLTPLARAQLGDETFADIWDLHLGADGVFFRALKHVFRYQPGSGALDLWRHAERFGAITEYQGKTVLQFRSEGLRELQGNTWAPVPGSAALADLVYQFLPLPDGALLALCRDGRWLRFHQGRTSELRMPPGTPAASVFLQASRLDDSRYALPADDGSLHVFDPATLAAQRLDVASGLLAGVTRAADGGLLAVDNETLIHLAWPSRWTVTGPEQGLEGTMHALRSWGKRWLALSANGVQEVVAENGKSRFQKRDWTAFEAWDLLALDARSALLADSYSVKLIDARGARELTHAGVYPRVLQGSQYDPEIVFIGGEMGLSILRREAAGAWRLILEPKAGEEILVTSLKETAPGELWLGTERHGLRRVRLSEDFTRIVEHQALNQAHGLAYGRIPGAYIGSLPDDRLLVTSDKGFFIWNGSRFERSDLDGLEALRTPDVWLRVVAADNGDTWAYSHNRVYRRPANGDWSREPVGGILRGGIEDLSFDDGGARVRFASGDGVLQYDLGAARSVQSRAPRLALRAVEYIDEDRNLRSRLPLQPAQPMRYTQGRFGLSFRFALPDYLREDGVRYQARLRGFSETFPEWSESRIYTYNRLEPGEYRFEARALDNHGRISEIEPYTFIVRPVWYRSGWALGLWILLGVAAVIGLTLWVDRRRAQHLERERIRLENMVAERTRELESANTQLDLAAHLDGLTELANRRRLNDYLEQAWAWCLAAERPLAVVVVDVDHFKLYNDRYGHLAGDDVLKQIGRILAHGLRRADDLAARYGGDEFVLVLPGADLAAAVALTEALRRTVEDSAIGTSISAGVAARTPQARDSVSDLLHSADEALYAAKRNGRNRLAVAKPATDGDHHLP